MPNWIPEPVARVLVWTGAVLAAVFAVLSWGQSKKREGAAEAVAGAKEEDFENAQDIRQRVSDRRDERVRSLDDAGFRD